MAERLNLLAWGILSLGFLMKQDWMMVLGLVVLLLFAMGRRVFLPFRHFGFRLLGVLGFLLVVAALIYYFLNPTQNNLYLALAVWLLAALYDLLVEVYYGK